MTQVTRGPPWRLVTAALVLDLPCTAAAMGCRPAGTARLLYPTSGGNADPCRVGAYSDVHLSIVCYPQAAYMSKLGLSSAKIGAGTVVGIILAAVVIALVAGYGVHRLRMRRVMQNEIRDIMCAQALLPPF